LCTYHNTQLTYTDKNILQKAEEEGWNNGSTAVAALIINNILYLANTGDAEAVMGVKKDDRYEAVLLSEKHKPATEKPRVEKAGGRVIFGRIGGNLAVSRALGDIEYKFPYNQKTGGSDDWVTSDPYTNKYELTPDVGFIVLACDGLW
jgi:serine/threonine protein phosphatase PrpC